MNWHQKTTLAYYEIERIKTALTGRPGSAIKQFEKSDCLFI